MYCPPCPPVTVVIDTTLYVDCPPDTVIFKVPCDDIRNLPVGDTSTITKNDGTIAKYWKDLAGNYYAQIQTLKTTIPVNFKDTITVQPPTPKPVKCPDCPKVKYDNFKLWDKFIYSSGYFWWVAIILMLLYRRLTTSK